MPNEVTYRIKDLSRWNKVHNARHDLRPVERARALAKDQCRICCAGYFFRRCKCRHRQVFCSFILGTSDSLFSTLSFSASTTRQRGGSPTRPHSRLTARSAPVRRVLRRPTEIRGRARERFTPLSQDSGNRGS